jgi:hypothetical protein
MSDPSLMFGTSQQLGTDSSPAAIRGTEFNIGGAHSALIIRLPDHLAPFLGVVGDELAEVGKRPGMDAAAPSSSDINAHRLMGAPPQALRPHITTPLRKNAAVHHSKNCALMSQMGRYC